MNASGDSSLDACARELLNHDDLDDDASIGDVLKSSNKTFKVLTILCRHVQENGATLREMKDAMAENTEQITEKQDQIKDLMADGFARGHVEMEVFQRTRKSIADQLPFASVEEALDCLKDTSAYDAIIAILSRLCYQERKNLANSVRLYCQAVILR